MEDAGSSEILLEKFRSALFREAANWYGYIGLTSVVDEWYIRM
jgi:hypothetical protein